MGVERK